MFGRAKSSGATSRSRSPRNMPGRRRRRWWRPAPRPSWTREAMPLVRPRHGNRAHLRRRQASSPPASGSRRLRRHGECRAVAPEPVAITQGAEEQPGHAPWRATGRTVSPRCVGRIRRRRRSVGRRLARIACRSQRSHFHRCLCCFCCHRTAMRTSKRCARNCFRRGTAPPVALHCVHPSQCAG